MAILGRYGVAFHTQPDTSIRCYLLEWTDDSILTFHTAPQSHLSLLDLAAINHQQALSLTQMQRTPIPL
jgi:hypothetical protein